ncbi:MAG: hypothetical protein WBA67_06855, partial [Jannaschia sp.]
VGQLVEGEYADSFLAHENKYVAWMEEDWSQNLETLSVTQEQIVSSSASSANVRWKDNGNGQFIPSLELNLPGCSGLPVYVTFYEVGSSPRGLSEICDDYSSISAGIVRKGWCERDIVNLAHNGYNHPMPQEDWLELRARYFALITENTRTEIATQGIGAIIGEGRKFPIERVGPYFPNIVERWETLQQDNTQDIEAEDVEAVEALSDITSYLAARHILAERIRRAAARDD